MKPLASWTRDLVQRMDQLEKWATTAHPPIIFWMSGFTFPTGFLTAILQVLRLHIIISSPFYDQIRCNQSAAFLSQTSARQNNISVDTLSWEFTVMTVDDSNITGPPKVWFLL